MTGFLFIQLFDCLVAYCGGIFINVCFDPNDVVFRIIVPKEEKCLKETLFSYIVPILSE